MIKYNLYKRAYTYISRQIFRLLFASQFKYYGEKVSIISPDIIEGEEYIYIENRVSIGTKSWLLAYKQDNIEPNLHISEGATIGRFAHIVALRKVVIGKDVLIADKVYISDNIHSYEEIKKPIKNQPIQFKSEVIIGDNSWIGENVSIVGAKIGTNCVIGTNSFVNKDIPNYCVAIGSPAKIIKRYDEKAHIWRKTNDKGKFLDEC